MGKWLFLVCHMALAMTAAEGEPQDHGDSPSAFAQWTTDFKGAPIDSLNFHRLYNNVRKKHLTTTGGDYDVSGDLSWGTVPGGRGTVFFENCTRPGEIIYGSDIVAIRFGRRFLSSTGKGALEWKNDRSASCEFQLIPRSSGFVPVGSGDGTFAIYNIRYHHYLIYESTLLLDPRYTLLLLDPKYTLVWRDGAPPGGILASADFIPISLLFNMPKSGDNSTVAYLSIKNIGNVRSSDSQQVMKVNVYGQQLDFLVLHPVPPGGILQGPIVLKGRLVPCMPVLVQLDTDLKLKFQLVGRAGLPYQSVFSNDKKILTAEALGVPRYQCSKN